MRALFDWLTLIALSQSNMDTLIMMHPNTQEELIDSDHPGITALDSGFEPNSMADLNCHPSLLPNNCDALAELSQMKSALTKHQNLTLIGTIAWCLTARLSVRPKDWEILGQDLPPRVLWLCQQLDEESLFLVMFSSARTLFESTHLHDRAFLDR
jgi:hypothetical protein